MMRGNFVLLRADELRLLLPQADVGAASYLDRGDVGEPAVLALSAQMLPLPEYPKDRFLVTPIATSQGEIGFGWTEVSVLIDAQLQPQALPPALMSDKAPLKEFVEIEGHVVFCCDARHMAEYALANRG